MRVPRSRGTRSPVLAEDELSGADGLLLPLALGDARERDLDPALDLLERDGREAPADTASDRHRRREAHLVEAVVDPHPVTLELRADLVPEADEQRERQEPVRDRRPERPLR